MTDIGVKREKAIALMCCTMYTHLNSESVRLEQSSF